MTPRPKAPRSLGSVARVLYDITQGFDFIDTDLVNPASHEDLLGRAEPGSPR